MTELVNFDVDYKALVKEKLLDAYEQNPLILEKIIQLRNKGELNSNYRFFHTYFLAGIVVSLCPPEVTNLILLMLEVNSDINAVLDSLKLNFDPQLELEKRAEERKLAQEATLVQDNNVIGLLSEDLEYREVQEGIEEIRAQFKQLENSS
jgi:hypothetical protein